MLIDTDDGPALWRRSFFFLLAAVAVHGAEPPAIRQEAYVWQRNWDAAVADAIREAAPTLDGLVALGAEVVWRDGQHHIVRVPVSWPVMRAAGKPAGIALRIGAYRGAFDKDTGWLTGLAAELVAERPAELQIDFDCAASKLDGYRHWIAAIRHRVSPVPVTITVLPAWLDQPGFVPLVRATDGFVLQVHSLERPSTPDAPLTLCDPAAARRAMATAATFGVPFRVALPTYGYIVAFDAGGNFIGLSAEGPQRSWPTGATLRTLRADAGALAGLVRQWREHRPTNMTGIIWYRLPTHDDTLNWRWATLASLIAGRVPRPDVQASARRVEAGLVQIEVRNAGDADAALPASVTVTSREATIVAGDAVGGYERLDSTARGCILRAKTVLALQRLAPGEGRVIGWLRLSADKEVSVYVTTAIDRARDPALP